MKIGIKLRKLRNKFGYSQENLASILKMSQANYCRIENDNLPVSNDKLDIIANIYGITVPEIFSEELNSNLHLQESVKVEIVDLLNAKEQIINIQNRYIELLEEKIKTFTNYENYPDLMVRIQS